MNKSFSLDLTDRFVNQPALVAPALAEQMRAEFSRSQAIQLAQNDVDAQVAMFDRILGGDRPYRMMGSVAVIPVTGTLLHRYNWSSSWATGYDFIASMTELAEKDPGVRGIAYDFQTGGGQVDGAFECADVMKAAKKPTLALINAHAYSAGYLLASACKRRVVARSGGAGSIGVVTMHADVSKMLDDIGYKITFIFAGDHKVDGNPYQPLPKAVKARYQERIDGLYELFTSTVAANTGLSVDAVVATQADCFTAEEALQLGLVDAIESPKEALKAFVAELNGDNFGSFNMEKPNTGAEQPATTAASAITQEQMDAAVTAARAEGQKAGAAAERERFNKVLASEHFAGREKLACKLLANEAMSADNIVEALAEVPAAAAKPGASAFHEAMNNGEQPGVDAGGEHNQPQKTDAERMLESYGAASGQKLQ